MQKQPQFLNNTCCYFISHRGTRNRNLFRNTNDYQFYFRLIKKYKRQSQIKLFAFCLLPDAVHLIIQPRNHGCVPLFLRALYQQYQKYYASCYRDRGPFWQRQYTEEVITNDVQLLTRIKDIEFLPITLFMTITPVEYLWSSCSYRVLAKNNSILDTQVFPTCELKSAKDVLHKTGRLLMSLL